MSAGRGGEPAGEAGAPTSAAGGSMSDSGSAGTGVAGEPESGAGGAAGNDGQPALSCVPGAPVDGCTLHDETGIYVDPTSGNDAALGTREAPLASAAKALLIAADLGKPVYLCNAEFDEPVEASDGAVALRGGYTCSGDERGAWIYAEGTRATIRPSVPEIALSVRNVAEFAVSDVGFYAADAEAAGASSVAAFVASSVGVTFKRVVLHAGSGRDGTDAKLEPFVMPDPLTLNGNPSQNNVPGPAKECRCPAGDMTRGAAGAAMGLPGEDGEPDWGAGAGGIMGQCSVASGDHGGNAPIRSPGAGAQLVGRLLEDGWHPEPGADGPHGQPGQGGGGGTGSSANAIGGAGACGGCGGRGGPGGQGGGGSIALMALDSEITFKHSVLQAANGGNGGNGDSGQAGQPGGASGAVPVNHCPGGDGGTGAAGGAGGGGAGGISSAVLSRTSRVVTDSSTTLDVGNAGSGGLGGVPGVNDGINGSAGDRLTLD